MNPLELQESRSKEGKAVTTHHPEEPRSPPSSPKPRGQCAKSHAARLHRFTRAHLLAELLLLVVVARAWESGRPGFVLSACHVVPRTSKQPNAL